jgi:hypothetical protein
MDRRSFLKKGLLGGALLVFGGTGLALFPTRHLASPTRPLLALDDRGFQVLVAVARRIVPGSGVDAVTIAHSVDDSLALLPIEAQTDLVKLLGLLENALPGLLLDGQLGPFTGLDGPEQDRALERWRDSRIALRRGGYQALRKLCLAAFYADPGSWSAIHYAGPPNTATFTFDDSRTGTPAWLAEQAGKGSAP